MDTFFRILYIPVFIGLFWILAFSFTKGLSSGFQSTQKHETTFSDSLSKAITRGWVYLIPALIPYIIVFIFTSFVDAFDIGMDAHAQFLLLFGGGIAVLIITPGVYIAKKVGAQYPSASKETVISVASVWALVLPLSIALAILTGLAISFKTSASTAQAQLSTIFFFFANLIFGKIISKKLCTWLLK